MIRGELAIRRDQSATNLYSVGHVLAQTMMQLCASATRLRGGGPILQGGPKTRCRRGVPPPRTVICSLLGVLAKTAEIQRVYLAPSWGSRPEDEPSRFTGGDQAPEHDQ